MSKRVNKDKENYFAYGKLKGHFYFENPLFLFDFICKNKFADDFIFVDIRTKYFKLYWDVDLKAVKSTPGLAEYIVMTIQRVLRKLIKPIEPTEEANYFDYIYCDKSDDSPGLHLYFPNIIVDSTDALLFYNEVIEEIIKSGFKLTENDYRKIIDEWSAKGNGLKMLFQVQNLKSGEYGAYYKINREKSTFKVDSENMVEHLILTCIKSDANKCNYIKMNTK